jgi:hypothetical protein
MRNITLAYVTAVTASFALLVGAWKAHFDPPPQPAGPDKTRLCRPLCAQIPDRSRHTTYVAIQRFLLTILLIVSLVGFIKAQETTAERADTDEEVKKEILKLQDEFTEALLRGGSVAADFIDRYDADDITITVNGIMSTKAKVMAEFRSGERKQLSVQHDDFSLHVYGNTVVVTYRGHNVTQRKGTVSESSVRTTDVLVKQGKVWRRVVHNVNPVPVQ